MKKCLILASAMALFVNCSNEELPISSNITPDGAPLSEYEPITFSTPRTTVSFTRSIIDKWDGTQHAGLFVVENDQNSNWAFASDSNLHPFTQNVPCIVNNAPILINEVSADEVCNIEFVRDPLTFTGGDLYYYPRVSIDEEAKNYMFFGYYPYVQSVDDSIKISASSIEITGNFVEKVDKKPGKAKDIMACFDRVEDPFNGKYGWNSSYIKAKRDNGEEVFPTLKFEHLTSLLKYNVSKGDDNNFSFAFNGLVNAFIIVPKTYTLTLGKPTGSNKTVGNVDLKFSWDATVKDTIYLFGEEIKMYKVGEDVRKGDVRMYKTESDEYPKAYLFTKGNIGNEWDKTAVMPYVKYYPADYELTQTDKDAESKIKDCMGDDQKGSAVCLTSEFIEDILFAPTFGAFATPQPLEIYITDAYHGCVKYEVPAPSGDGEDGFFHANHIYNLLINMGGLQQLSAKAVLNAWDDKETTLGPLSMGNKE